MKSTKLKKLADIKPKVLTTDEMKKLFGGGDDTSTPTDPGSCPCPTLKSCCS